MSHENSFVSNFLDSFANSLRTQETVEVENKPLAFTKISDIKKEDNTDSLKLKEENEEHLVAIFGSMVKEIKDSETPSLVSPEMASLVYSIHHTNMNRLEISKLLLEHYGSSYSDREYNEILKDLEGESEQFNRRFSRLSEVFYRDLEREKNFFKKGLDETSRISKTVSQLSSYKDTSIEEDDFV